MPLARLTGITSNQLDAATWQLATNLNGGNAALASNVVSGISITNAFITNSVFAGNGSGLTNLNAQQLSGGSSGSQNFYVGAVYNPGQTGYQNTGLGVDALFDNTSGFDNTAVGYQALNYNTGEYGNTAFGAEALSVLTSGYNNTAVGYEALVHSSAGTNNIALGYQAGYGLFGGESSNIDIGNLGVTGDQGIIRIGTPGIQTTTFIAGVINGNGSGLTNLNALQLSGRSGGSQNFYVGAVYNPGQTGYQNTGLGVDALFDNTSGFDNTAVGYQALNYNTGEYGNTAFGAEALSVLTSGYNNTAVGYEALVHSSAGTNNIALGYQAGYGIFGGESSNIDIGNLGVTGRQASSASAAGIQTTTFIAGVINGNGGGLTNLNARQLVTSMGVQRQPELLVGRGL